MQKHIIQTFNSLPSSLHHFTLYIVLCSLCYKIVKAKVLPRCLSTMAKFFD